MPQMPDTLSDPPEALATSGPADPRAPGGPHDRGAPRAPRFSIPIVPAAEDIDELGHVSNLVYLRWVQDVATAHSRALGWDVARYRAEGAVFMVRRHEIDYVAQVTLGQTLRAETWVDSWRLASCVRKTELVRDGVVVARAATTWAMIGLATGRPTKIPDELRALFA